MARRLSSISPYSGFLASRLELPENWPLFFQAIQAHNSAASIRFRA